jgi:hypothetical protein
VERTTGPQQLPNVEMKQEKYEEVVRDLILVKLKKVEVWTKTGTNWTKEKKAPTSTSTCQCVL